MVENSKIEWTTHTFNPWLGCSKVSPACDHCYAESWAKRTGQSQLWAGERRRTSDANWRKPLKWDAAAAAQKIRPRVFCASLADVFDNHVPDAWRYDLFNVIEMTPHLDWLLLSKRIGNAERMLPWRPYGDPFKNVWVGSTVVNQEEFDRDVPKLLTVTAAVRFLSVEPMLGPIEFERHGSLNGLHWVICGGESGSKARPLPVEWVQRLHAQCRARGIAFFMKQGSQADWPDWKDSTKWVPSLRVREYPRGATSGETKP